MIHKHMYLLLKNHSIRPTRNVLKWAEQLESMDRQVALDRVGSAVVSTVFIGVNTRLKGPPMVFETAVWGGERDFDIVRKYSSWTAAEKGHREQVDALKRCAPQSS